MRADNIYFRMFSDYVYTKYLESEKSESLGLLGSIIYSDPWTADYWSELFIAANEANGYTRTDLCAYAAMVQTIRNYGYKTKDKEIIALTNRLIVNYEINEAEYNKWLQLKKSAIITEKSKGYILLYGRDDWKTEYLSEFTI